MTDQKSVLFSGGAERQVATNRSGRKRPRNERFNEGIPTSNTTFSRLKVVGIAVFYSLHFSFDRSSFAFAFHSTPLRTSKQRLRHIYSKKNKKYLRKHTLNDITGSGKIYDLDEPNEKWEFVDENRKYDDRSLDSTLAVVSSSLVHSSSLSSSPSTSLPPWLVSIEEQFTSFSSLREASKRIRREIETLECSLLSFRGGDLFSKTDVKDIIRAIYWCASSNSGDRNVSRKVSKVIGSVSFCKLFLQLEGEKHEVNKGNRSHSNLITKDILLASILHFSECIDLRYDGAYEEVQNAILLKSSDDKNNEGTTNAKTIVLSTDKNTYQEHKDSSIVMRSSQNPLHYDNDDTFEDIFSPESLELSNAAKRLKKIEVLTSATLTSRGDQQRSRRPLKNEEYAAIRNLMVSLTDDWRALAIRCVASLFRLEGILMHSKMNAGTGQFSVSRRDSESILAAKDSLRMYANLSQQMGLHRLQAQLEAKAFSILYPRQYSASSVLFQEHGTAMRAISEFLSNQLKQMLYEDLSLMYELENLEVVSRVKEPYSFWKKMVKKRIVQNEHNINAKSSEQSLIRKSESFGQKGQIMHTPSSLSFLEINDGVALRVIFKARKLQVEEPSETTKERERMLCYYIHHIVRSKWPETHPDRVKDYVRYPKANGYQSLHHTSKITRNKKDFFFEVQIRSEEMHRIAEFGVAAHSAYKLGGNISPDSFPLLKPSPLRPSPSTQSTAIVSSTEKKTSHSLDHSSQFSIVSKGEVGKGDDSLVQVVRRSNIENSGPYIHALKKTRDALMQSHVYVFLAGGSSSPLETGQLLTLSAGSLILNVLETLRENYSDFTLRDQDVSVWCNGNLAPLDRIINNGDTIMIQPILSSLPALEEFSVNKTSALEATIIS